jgi:hypothetical protein
MKLTSEAVRLGYPRWSERRSSKRKASRSARDGYHGWSSYNLANPNIDVLHVRGRTQSESRVLSSSIQSRETKRSEDECEYK